MAFKRSAVRFRLAPPISRMRASRPPEKAAARRLSAFLGALAGRIALDSRGACGRVGSATRSCGDEHGARHGRGRRREAYSRFACAGALPQADDRQGAARGPRRGAAWGSQRSAERGRRRHRLGRPAAQGHGGFSERASPPWRVSASPYGYRSRNSSRSIGTKFARPARISPCCARSCWRVPPQGPRASTGSVASQICRHARRPCCSG